MVLLTEQWLQLLMLSEAAPSASEFRIIMLWLSEYKKLNRSCNPAWQASVAAALSRDVVFGRPAPATYCLASFLTAAALCAFLFYLLS